MRRLAVFAARLYGRGGEFGSPGWPRFAGIGRWSAPATLSRKSLVTLEVGSAIATIGLHETRAPTPSRSSLKAAS